MRVATKEKRPEVYLMDPSLCTLVRIATQWSKNPLFSPVPSLRTLVRIATAYMHKMFGACTDYYVHLNLIECEGRPGGPGSYSHYLDFGTGSRPLILVRSSYTKYVCFRLAQTQPQICDG